ncbi:hypothetical protein CCYA_CCYA11G3025 [Cyanidiococcus yangmingshanensis]|nr:hypothetical protein CCYA_CCYA11G3025 [Cyanidiococcus yangmingshanensis]
MQKQTPHVPVDDEDALPPPTELRWWREHEQGLANLAEQGTSAPSVRRDADWADVALPLPVEAMHENRGRLDASLCSRLDELEARESQLEAERAVLRAQRRNKPPAWRGFLLRASANASVEDGMRRLQIRDHKPVAKDAADRTMSADGVSVPSGRATPHLDDGERRVSRFKQRQLERRAHRTFPEN